MGMSEIGVYMIRLHVECGIIMFNCGMLKDSKIIVIGI